MRQKQGRVCLFAIVSLAEWGSQKPEMKWWRRIYHRGARFLHQTSSEKVKWNPSKMHWRTIYLNAVCLCKHSARGLTLLSVPCCTHHQLMFTKCYLHVRSPQPKAIIYKYRVHCLHSPCGFSLWLGSHKFPCSEHELFQDCKVLHSLTKYKNIQTLFK